MLVIQGNPRYLVKLGAPKIGSSFSNFLMITVILGTGVKLGPVAVLDEVGLLIFGVSYLLIRRRLSIPSIDNIYNLCLGYFSFVYLIGFVSSLNVNALRYVVMPIMIILGVNLKLMDAPSVRTMEVISYIYIILTLVWPVFGLVSGYAEAWWQDWIWTGTTYATFGLFMSASILIWYGGLIRSIIVLLLVFVSGVLNDSRLTLLLGVLLLLPLIRLLLSRRREVHVSKRRRILGRIMNVALFLVVLTVFFRLFSDDEIGPRVPIVVENVMQTVVDLVERNPEQDVDRLDWNRASLDLLSENMFHFLFGAGGLSHQYDMMGRGLSSSEARIRPTGIPAIVFDGGILLLGLIFVSALSSALYLIRKRPDVLGGIFLASIPIVSFLILFVVNMLDCVLFWLVFKPGFLSKIFIEHRNRT